MSQLILCSRVKGKTLQPVPKKQRFMKLDPADGGITQHFYTRATSTGEQLDLGVCVFRPELGEYCHLPVGYGGNFARRHPDGHPVFCTKCRLQPCLNDEYKKELFGYGHMLVETAQEAAGGSLDDDNLSLLHGEVCDILTEKARAILESIFGSKCIRRHRTLPKCIWSQILATFPSSHVYDTDSEDEEDEPDASGSHEAGSSTVYVNPTIDLSKHLGLARRTNDWFPLTMRNKLKNKE